MKFQNIFRICSVLVLLLVLAAGFTSAVNIVKNSGFENGNVNFWNYSSSGCYSFGVQAYPSSVYDGVYSSFMIGNTEQYCYYSFDVNPVSGLNCFHDNGKLDCSFTDITITDFSMFLGVNYAQSGCFLTTYSVLNSTINSLSKTNVGAWTQFNYSFSLIDQANIKRFVFYCKVGSPWTYKSTNLLDNVIVNFGGVDCATSGDCDPDSYCQKITNTCVDKISNGGSCGLAVECDDAETCFLSCESNQSLYGVCVPYANCPAPKTHFDDNFMVLMSKDKGTGAIEYDFRKYVSWDAGMSAMDGYHLNYTVYSLNDSAYSYFHADSSDWLFMGVSDSLYNVITLNLNLGSHFYFFHTKFTQTNYLNANYQAMTKFSNESCSLYEVENAYHFYECNPWLIFNDWCMLYDNTLYTGIFWNTTNINNFSASPVLLPNGSVNPDVIKYVLVIPKFDEEVQAWTRIVIDKSTGQMVYNKTVDCSITQVAGEDMWYCENYANFTGLDQSDKYDFYDIFNSVDGFGRTIRNGQTWVTNITYNISRGAWAGVPVNDKGVPVGDGSKVDLDALNKNNTYWAGTGNITIVVPNTPLAQPVTAETATTWTWLIIIIALLVAVFFIIQMFTNKR